MNLLLTQAERDKFATWLENEAETSKGLVAQLEKLGPAGALMIKREISEAAASVLIARKLRSIQSSGH